MTRIQNILVGIDLHHGDRHAATELSEESQAAVAEALQLASTWEATLTFCSVLELSVQSQSLIEHDRENIFKTVEDFANELLTKLVEQANALGIACESVLRYGTAWEELTKESTDTDYDLLLIGTRRKSRATRFLFGSTAHNLLRFAACPVWVIKATELREIRDVAIATDFGASSVPAFHLAVTVARAIGARLHVLHVVEQADLRYLTLAGITAESVAQTEQRLRDAAEENVRLQLQQTDFRTVLHGVKIELLAGAPDSVIPEYVVAQQIDLLVVGTHGQTNTIGYHSDSTAERILPDLHSSLLVAKPIGFRSPYADVIPPAN